MSQFLRNKLVHEGRFGILGMCLGVQGLLSTRLANNGNTNQKNDFTAECGVSCQNSVPDYVDGGLLQVPTRHGIPSIHRPLPPAPIPHEAPTELPLAVHSGTDLLSHGPFGSLCAGRLKSDVRLLTTAFVGTLCYGS